MPLTPPTSQRVDATFVDVCFRCGGAEPVLSETEARRVACLYLITRLADRGLPEALESLRDMVTFYDVPPAPALTERGPQPVRGRSIGERAETYPTVLDLD